MPNNEAEVFTYFISDGDTALEIDYLAYAMFAHRKWHWIEHFAEANNNRKPNQGEIDNWISQLTSFDFQSMREEAAEFFDGSAKAYLEEYIKVEKQNAVDRSILAQVRQATSLGRHIGIAFLMAIIAPVILGGLIFLWQLEEGNLSFHIILGKPAQTSESPPTH